MPLSFRNYRINKEDVKKSTLKLFIGLLVACISLLYLYIRHLHRPYCTLPPDQSLCYILNF